MIRLDIYLSKTNTYFSRAGWQKYIRKIGVKINGKLTKKPHFFINEKDSVEVPNVIEDSPDRLKMKDIPKINIPRIYESENFIVFDKPAHIRTEDVIHGMASVHRLDKDTSGILIAAKNLQTQVTLQAQWQKRTVKKTYIALVKGKLSPRQGSIEAPIFRSMIDRKKMSVSSHKKARAATTKYKVLDYLVHDTKDYSLVQFSPVTGRTHQIRVHSASIGFPIVGDDVYGDKNLNKYFEKEFGLERQFLHAHKLALINPDTKKRQEFISQMPKELNSVISKLKK